MNIIDFNKNLIESKLIEKYGSDFEKLDEKIKDSVIKDVEIKLCDAMFNKIVNTCTTTTIDNRIDEKSLNNFMNEIKTHIAVVKNEDIKKKLESIPESYMLDIKVSNIIPDNNDIFILEKER